MDGEEREKNQLKLIDGLAMAIASFELLLCTNEKAHDEATADNVIKAMEYGFWPTDFFDDDEDDEK